LALVLSLGTAFSAQAQDCSDFGGVLDGFAGDIAPSQLQIDVNCTIRNYPASNPISTNFSFFTQPGQTDERYLVIFDNVVHTGNMSCNATHEHKIWFTNGSSSKIRQNCQNLLIPVEKIDKQNPAGQTAAAIGVPFTYTLTIPVLFDPATGGVIQTDGSVNDLHSVLITDNLNETGADLTYVSHTAFWLNGGAPVPHTFSNVGGLLTFDVVPVIPAGDQIVIEITVVLDDTPANVPGSQFVNTAKWQFGRLIDGVFFEPLPGEWGITEPLTIAAPELVMTKTGPATLGLSLNLGEVGDFSLDVQNTGLSDAWDVTIVDQLPDGASGGMCDLTPTVVNAQVFQSDGTTPVSGPLVQGTDYSFSYAGAPSCELTLTLLTAAGVIGPGERLIIDYQTKLDSDSQDGAVLTNVAGATEWFNGDPANPDRVTFTRVLTDGSPGTPDHEDAHSVTVEIDGIFFEKSVENLTSGVSPTTTAAPGDTLRYTLRLQATQLQLDDLTIQDDLGDLNASQVFVPGSLTLVSAPAGADTSNTDPNGGADGEGILDVRNLDVPALSDVQVVFDITVDPSVVDGTLVLNQADLISAGNPIADSDDPNINGQSDPDVVGDEDPTQVLIAELPVGPLLKENTQATATIGEAFTYQITVPATPYPNDLYDVRITDDLTTSGADLRFLGVTKVSPGGAWMPQNTGTDTNLVIEDPSGGIDIPAGEQIVIEISVVLEDTLTNVAGLQFANTAAFVFNTVDGDAGSERPGDQDTTDPMTIVEPDLTMTKSGPPQMTLGVPEAFTLDVQNAGDSPAYQVTVSDQLPDGATGGMCDAAPTLLTAQVFQADGTTPVSGALAQGVDFTASFAGAPSCLWTLDFTSAQTAIGVGERLILGYETTIDADTQNGVALTNVAGATEWLSTDGSNPLTAADRRTYTEVLTDGTVGVLDHEDAHSVGVALPAYLFEKTVVDPGTGTPITTAAPGDTLRYRLRLENIGQPDFVDLDFSDELDALNVPPAFEPGSLTLVTVPAGADTGGTDPNGGAQGTGLLDIADLSLNTGGTLLIEFDITLASTLVDGTVVTNQSQLQLNGALFTQSDDPNVNGPADPFVAGDEDPTQVLIAVPAVGALRKENTQATATIGESFAYRITVPETPFAFPMYDVRITDDLTTSGADLRFLGVTKISPGGAWTPQNTGTDTALVIEDTSIGIDIPAGEQVVVEITVVLEDTSGNFSGQTFTNTADYTFNFADGDDTSELPGGPGTTPPMTIVEPNLTMAKSGPAQMVIGTPETFTLDVQNAGDSPAYEVVLSDRFPDGATGGTCDVAPTLLSAQVFQADGTTPVSGALAVGVDLTSVFAPAPTCLWTLAFSSAQTAIGVGERLIVTYETELDVDTQASAMLTNVAGATRWFSTDGSDPATVDDRHTYIELLTDGTVGTVDHEDAHTIGTGLPDFLFEKTVVDPGTGTPITTASPGDTLRYRLRLENRGGTTLSDLGFSDELDRLNAQAVFQPGTLTLFSVPAGADTSGTNPNGGAQGTGVIDVRGLSAAPGEILLLEFDITLLPVIPNATVATNQSQLLVNDIPFVDSDDPGVNGPADPDVVGDEDPTQVLIQSAPDFQVEKISAYVTGDPTVLLAGETLRYTITVKNVGTDDAVDTMLRDAIPANTQYVPGSTTLNGSAVPDGGTSPLASGILLNAPEDPTPGAMRADASATTSNVATIVFDVIVDANLIDGTVISNQAFVSAPNSGVFDQPSDDPRTPVADDPTRDVVGNVPLLFAPKSVALLIDNGVIGQIDPGDRLRYTITVFNNSATPATGVVLTDTVPNDTTYVDDTTTLNGNPVGQPDGGVPPLASGVPIASPDQPAPGPGGGTISPGESAVLEFDVDVDALTPSGTIISNQAVVATAELPDLLTDGDGNPATGPEPTQVVVGDGQQLSITKQVVVVGGGPALAGSTLEYLVLVTNIATVPAVGVVLTDDLDMPVPNQLSYVAGSATMNGAATGVTVVDPLITADYSGSYGPLQPGETITLRFQAVLDPNPIGTTVTNVATVTWNTTQTNSASVSLNIGGTPGVGAVSGTAWHDIDFDDALGAGEPLLEGWSVELLLNGAPIQSVTTDSNGAYSIGGIPPNDVSGDQYALRFSAPGAGANTAALGLTNSAFTDGPQQITDIIVMSGSSFQDLNLPIDPNGVVYSAVSRIPVSGATLTLLNAGTGAPVDPTCFDDPAQQDQVTLASGHYKFDLNFSDGSCLDDSAYLLSIAVPNGNYTAGLSQVIPPSSDGTTSAFSVPGCPGTPDDTVPAPAGFCEVQPLATAPDPSVTARSPGTAYYLHLTLDSSQSPGSSQIFNNHIPLDPVLGGTVAISKTTPQQNVSRGQLVPYEIQFSNALAAPIPDLSIVDNFPAGFTYVEGSARVDGVPIEPDRIGRELVWSDLGIDGLGQRSLLLLLAVGAGVTEGEFTNRAVATSSATGLAYSGEAQATVRVVPDPTFDCTDVLGKVYDDANRNGIQDDAEDGLQGVRVATARGLVATTDQYGRFHITCAVVPREERGSNFVLKLDDRTLPSGYRMTTRQTQVRRATRGKALRFQFGATIHRVVGLDLADAVFEPGTTEMRMQWEPRLVLLLDELAKEPAMLRLSYVADIEDPSLVERRMRVVKKAITDAWTERGGDELAIETEIFWRRGGPPSAAGAAGASGWDSLLPSVDAGPPAGTSEPGEAVERHLPIDEPFTQWSQDPERLQSESGDRLEERAVVSDEANTIKLRDVVPPIRFESGVADIPQSTIQDLRDVLDGMRHLHNVRLHLVGHADDQALSPTLARIYGDNEGLSRERAGEVAEFIQTALGLPPEAISFSWAGDSMPIASNATPQGRALNRRVEVEVWYDELEATSGVEEVVIAEDIKRVKVCRTETVCKLTFREGHARRARVKNLIAPLHYEVEGIDVSDAFVRQVGEALHNLRDKQNVTVKFIGYTDDTELSGRTERIYGTHLALSKARAHRTALAIKDALELPTSAIASDGRGATQPLASNDTARGRALNRRIEVEFWHDDPLRELPDEPQLCPDAAGAEVVTKVYDPPWGRIAPLAVNGGKIEVPAGYERDLRRAMADVAGETNVRLRFVGYTSNERLDRRTALVYGDDIGLSAARARRAMEQIAATLELREEQAEHEGRGYVHSNDVVNGGFIQGDTSHVVVQVVYDELAVLDDYEGVEVTPITRELRPKDPLALNLMRITVDGVPIDDPGRSLADIQRCTDVALERADIRFRFDNLEAIPRLSVTSQPIAAPGDSGAAEGAASSAFRFRTWSNYGHFFERSEVRIFDQSTSMDADPIAVAEVDADGFAEWYPAPERFTAPVREMKFVLRAYDAEGRFDETAPQTLWLARGEDAAWTRSGEGTTWAPLGGDASGDPLLAGYGEGGPIDRNIALGSVGTAQVHGTGIPPEHSVWVAGSPVPVDDEGNFVAEVLLPSGMHTVEVAVLDASGNGELFLRDLEFKKSDWFYVGIADVTVATDLSGGPEDALQGEDAPYDRDSKTDGRLAFYVNGKFWDGWSLVASADTREEPVEDLFSNFMDKSPDALFRRIDPDYHYPTFGDDGIVEEMAPTQGKFYARLKKDESHATWGNFKIAYLENELAHVDRGLYGANLHYQSLDTTSYGEQRLVLDGFAADPGTVASREEFRGTGGSLYYLRRQDLLTGSERLRIEVRDKISGLVTGVVHLRPTLDYDIDYLQGRILLTEPMASTVADELLVRSEGLSGNEAWLVAQYEYTPGVEELDAWATGGQGHLWLLDWMRVGLTANRNEDEDSDADSSLYAADVTLRAGIESWLKVQAGRSDGLISSSLRSDDGGFLFQNTTTPISNRADADGYRADVSIGFSDLVPILDGRLSVYAQTLEAGYSAPGQTTLTDTDQFGGTFDLPLTTRLHLIAKADQVVEDDGLEIAAQEVDLTYQLTEHWSLGAGVRNDQREDDSPIVPITQDEGDRTDAVVQLGFDAGSQWSAYTFGQGTLRKTEDRDANHRGGIGGAYRITDRLAVDGEVSHGNLGPAVRLGTSFQRSENTQRYLSYALENERGYDGLHRRQGNLVSGVKTRMSDSSSVYLEDRYQHGDSATGLARAMGITLAPTDRWTLGATWELGTLVDERTHAETERRAGGVRVGYGFEDLHISSGVEYRFDDTEQLDGTWIDRTTWLFRNSLRYQVTPSGRIIGKFNHSISDSSQGEFFDGGYTEGVLGYAYRPVQHDRLHTLAKYTYFYNMPTTDQVSGGGSSIQFLQKSHVAAIDVTYDLTPFFSIGGKYAYRLSQVSLDRVDPSFFDNDAHLYILRGDWRFRKNWEGSLEGRMLDLPDQDERRAGTLFTVYRYLGDNLKVGVGYNFTDFSEDLTDLSYDHHGLFFNLVGTL
jgi:uncharacterized repeat protein (TIGR01451 family)/fimbrial isopeptide formation D2 family protein